MYKFKDFGLHIFIVVLVLCVGVFSSIREASAMIPPATSICVRHPDLCFEELGTSLFMKDRSGKDTRGYTQEDIQTYGEVRLKITYSYMGESPNQTVNLKFYCDKNNVRPDGKMDGLSESEANGKTFDCNYTGGSNSVWQPRVVVEKGTVSKEAMSGTVTLIGAIINADIYWKETKLGALKSNENGKKVSRGIEILGDFSYPGLQSGAQIIVMCGTTESRTIGGNIDRFIRGDGTTSEKSIVFDNFTCVYPADLDKKEIKIEVRIQKNIGAYDTYVKTYTLIGYEDIVADSEVYEYSATPGLVRVNQSGGIYDTGDNPVIRIAQSGYTGDVNLDKTTLYKIWGNGLSCQNRSGSMQIATLSSPVEYSSFPNDENPHDFYCQVNLAGPTTVFYEVLRGWAKYSASISLNINRSPVVNLTAKQSTIKSTDALSLIANVTDPDGNGINWVGFYYCSLNVKVCDRFQEYLPLSSSGRPEDSRSLDAFNPYNFSSRGLLKNGNDYHIIAAAEDNAGHPAIGLSKPLTVSVDDGTGHVIGTGVSGHRMNYGVGNKQTER